MREEQSVCTRGLQLEYEAMAIRIYTIHLVKTQIMANKVKGKHTFLVSIYDLHPCASDYIHGEKKKISPVEVTETVTENSEIRPNKSLLF